MAVRAGTGIVKDGLVFAYDHDDPKSFKGRPLTNYAYIQHARIDSSYASYEATASGNWPTNHADALTVYNNSGTNITGYVNTGVTDYTNTQHAIWTYDDELKRPVVTMRDWDSEWKAKNWALGYSMTGMGLSSSDNYTISWLQWTTDTGKSANAGLYGLDNLAANGFHDGLAHSVDETSTKNSKTHTWERVHCTFTVASNWDFTDPLNCYMYGYFNNDGTLRIADVQIEADSTVYSGFHGDSLTRSNTEAIIDRAGGHTVTAQALTYGDMSFDFDGTDDYITVADPGYPAAWTDNFSFEAWHFVPTGADWHDQITFGANSGTPIMGRGSYGGSHGLLRRDTNLLTFFIRTDTSLYYADYTATTNTWYHLVGTWDGTNNRLYVNGVLADTATPTVTGTPGQTTIKIGGNMAFGGTNGGYAEGEIPIARMYNKALSASEVIQNFNALRARFGV